MSFFRNRIKLIGKKVTDEDVVANLWVLACQKCNRPWVHSIRQDCMCCPYCWDLRMEPRLIHMDEIREVMRGTFQGVVRFQDGLPFHVIEEGIRSIPNHAIEHWRGRIQEALDRGMVHIQKRREAVRREHVYGPAILGSIWKAFAGKYRQDLKGRPRPRQGIGFAEE